MSSRQVIDWLSSEDLAEFRRLTAFEEVARSGNPGMNPNDAALAMIHCLEFHQAMAKKYQLEPDVNYYFSMQDGAIVESDEPS